MWFADSNSQEPDDEEEEEDEEDRTAPFFRIRIDDLDDFWLITHDGAMGIEEMAPPPGDEYILASVA